MRHFTLQIVLYLIYEEGMTEFRYHFATSNELINLDNNHHWWLTLQKEREPEIIRPLMESHITT